MKQQPIALIVLAVVALGALLWWVFSKKTLPEQIEKTVSPSLQSLTQNTYTKAEVDQLLNGNGTGNTVTDSLLDDYLDARGTI